MAENGRHPTANPKHKYTNIFLLFKKDLMANKHNTLFNSWAKNQTPLSIDKNNKLEPTVKDKANIIELNSLVLKLFNILYSKTNCKAKRKNDIKLLGTPFGKIKTNGNNTSDGNGGKLTKKWPLYIASSK